MAHKHMGQYLLQLTLHEVVLQHCTRTHAIAFCGLDADTVWEQMYCKM